jgi:hypothetical protein
MLYGVFDPMTREFCWASAGHQMPVLHLLDTDEIREVAEADSASGLPIGIFDDADYCIVTACFSGWMPLVLAREKGVRYRKCKAPLGPFRFSVPVPFFGTRTP